MHSMLRQFTPGNSITIEQSSPSSQLVDSQGFLRGPSIPPSLLGPNSLRDVEKLLHSVDTYVKGSFDAGTWSLDQNFPDRLIRSPQPDVGPLNNFYSLCISAHRLLKQEEARSPREAYNLIDKAFANVRPILEAEHHNTLLQLFSIILCFANSGFATEFLRLTLKFIYDMAGIVLGIGHPLSQITGFLYRSESLILTSIVAQAWEVLAASFESQLGESHYVCGYCRLRMIDSVYGNQQSSTAEPLLRKLLLTSTSVHGLDDLLQGSIRYSLARSFLQQGNYECAFKEASEILRQCEVYLLAQNPAAFALESSALHLMALAKYRSGQKTLAEPYLRQHVDFRAAMWGWQSPLVLHALLSLEEFLAAEQRHIEAAQVKQQRLQIIRLMGDIG
jgi:hypothetical protein